MHRSMQYATQQRIDRPELGPRLGTVGARDDDPIAVTERPTQTTVDRAIEHVVYVLRATRSGATLRWKRLYITPVSEFSASRCPGFTKPVEMPLRTSVRKLGGFVPIETATRISGPPLK